MNLSNGYSLHIRSSLAKKYLKFDLLNRFANCFHYTFYFISAININDRPKTDRNNVFPL